MEINSLQCPLASRKLQKLELIIKLWLNVDFIKNDFHKIAVQDKRVNEHFSFCAIEATCFFIFLFY